MTRHLKEVVADAIAYSWLEGHPHCGIPLWKLVTLVDERSHSSRASEAVSDAVRALAEEGLVRIPEGRDELWVFPTALLLEPRDPMAGDELGPYTKALRHSGSQVEDFFFDRQALERYRDDPRYRFDESGVSGFVVRRSDYIRERGLADPGKIYVRWGAAYSDGGSARFVTAILADLAEANVEHQLHWKSYEVDREGLLLDSDYFKTSVEGEFANRLSPFEAVVQEIQQINVICELIREPPLFRENFASGAPAQFAWITKPTLRSYQDLALTADKMLSDNLNKRFFRGKVDLQTRTETDDGVIIKEKGTIRLLGEFLEVAFEHATEERCVVISALKDVRNERNRPAHALDENEYDPTLMDNEYHLVHAALLAVRRLREILQTHPGADDYDPPRILVEAEIW